MINEKDVGQRTGKQIEKRYKDRNGRWEKKRLNGERKRKMKKEKGGKCA